MPPRGGRGGGGRRGGPSKPGFTRIGGMEIAYDPDVQSEKNGRPQPSKTFPDFSSSGKPSAPRPPTSCESQQLALQSHVRSLIRRSPLYTTFSGDSMPNSSSAYSSRFGPGATTPRITGKARGSKLSAASRAAAVDPFNVMPHYSDRYDQKRRKMPRLDQQKLRVVLNFFPDELHTVLDPTVVTKAPNGVAKRVMKERDSFDTNELEAAEADEAEAENATADEDEDTRERKSDRRRRAIAEEGEDVDEGEDETGEDGHAGVGDDGEVDEQDEDDDFEDDEEELAGDYNAEGYFDDGGDDAGDDDMDDGGGGDDYS